MISRSGPGPPSAATTDLWRLLYTALGTRRGHGVRDQRIGVAESPDLRTFRRIGDDPIVVADPGRHRTLDEDASASETWRDAFVFRPAGDDLWHMPITARAIGRPRRADGVLAHATSRDLQRWTVGAPVVAAAGFGQLEVPQVRRIGERWVLVFTCSPEEQTDGQGARFGRFSTSSVTADTALGPWEPRAGRRARLGDRRPDPRTARRRRLVRID